MAGKTGVAISKFVSEKKLRVKVVTSPIIRCVQTAAFIAVKIGVGSVSVENWIVECMHKEYMPLKISEVEINSRMEKVSELYFEGKIPVEILNEQGEDTKAEIEAHSETDLADVNLRMFPYFERLERSDVWDEYDVIIHVAHKCSLLSFEEYLKD